MLFAQQFIILKLVFRGVTTKTICTSLLTSVTATLLADSLAASTVPCRQNVDTELKTENNVNFSQNLFAQMQGILDIGPQRRYNRQLTPSAQ